MHTGEPHEGNEPALFDMTAPLCADFFGELSNNWSDQLVHPEPGNNAVGTAFMESLVRESPQGYGGGYHPHPGFGPPVGGNPELPPAYREPTEACKAEHPGHIRNFEARRKQIHCSCILDMCRSLPTESEQAMCTAENGFNYTQCRFEHTSCSNYFVVDTYGTGAYIDQAFLNPMPQAEISSYYNDQADPVLCGHEHAAYFVYGRSPGTKFGYIGSYAEGTTGTGTGHLGCTWDIRDQFGFEVPPVKAHSVAVRFPGGGTFEPGGLRILAASYSHGGHPCGYFGCNHPVGVRIDYSVQPVMSNIDDADQFWIEPDQTPLPTDERRTVGDLSQVVPRVGQNVFVSRPLGSPETPVAGDFALIDVFVPADQDNPNPVGQVELRVEILSAGISERLLGIVDLTGFLPANWSTLKFVLGDDVRNALRSHGDEAVFKLNVALTSNLEPTLIDNFRISGNLEAVGQSPVARCRDVSVPSGPACAPVNVTTAMVDAGSSDPNGDPITLGLTPFGPFGVGTTTVALRVADANFATSCNAQVTVTDSTPPSVTVPANVVARSCTDNMTVNVGQATATDDCVSSLVPTGEVVATNGVTLTTPIPVVAGQATLAPGVHTVRWTASDGAGTTSRTQTVTVAPAIQARESFLVGDRAVVRQPSGAGAGLVNSGSGLTRLSFDARAGGVVSVGAVQVLDRGILAAGIKSAAGISVSPSATVPGPLSPMSQVILPPLPVLPSFPAPVGSNLTVNSGSTLTLAPGSRPSVTVNSGGTLVLGAGDYFFRNFTISASSTVRAQTTTRVFVRDSLTVQSPFRTPSGSAVQSLFLGFAGSTLTFDAVFNGTLVAPNASVAFGSGSGLTYTGAFYARTIEVRPASTLVCLAVNAIVPT
jgi:hypothetical protein